VASGAGIEIPFFKPGKSAKDANPFSLPRGTKERFFLCIPEYSTPPPQVSTRLYVRGVSPLLRGRELSGPMTWLPPHFSTEVENCASPLLGVQHRVP